MMTIDEIWKPAVGWEDLYDVSNLGRVRSHGLILKIAKRISYGDVS